MRWDYWMALYLRTHCVARGLSPLSIAAYAASLQQFRRWIERHPGGRSLHAIKACDVLEYLEHLRRERDNGDSAVNRALVVLRSFYRAIVAMGHLDPAANPIHGFPLIKAVPRKLPVTLSEEEVVRLLHQPRIDTIIGIRDRALLTMLSGTGIRASECAGLREGQVDLSQMTVTVRGKGGHERTVPFNDKVQAVLKRYVQARGPALPTAPFFRSRYGGHLSRTSIYERVRTWGQRSHLSKTISPHRLRHTFATQLVRTGAHVVTVRDLLGHRQLSSTQIYMHVTARDLRAAADRHPIANLLQTVEHLLPNVRLPFQTTAPPRRYA